MALAETAAEHTVDRFVVVVFARRTSPQGWDDAPAGRPASGDDQRRHPGRRQHGHGGTAGQPLERRRRRQRAARIRRPPTRRGRTLLQQPPRNAQPKPIPLSLANLDKTHTTLKVTVEISVD